MSAERGPKSSEPRPSSPSSSGTHRIDPSRWPFVSHRLGPVVRSEVLDEMFARIDEALQREEAHVWILEIDDAIDLGATQRRALAE
jgi:hypothetical protein